MGITGVPRNDVTWFPNFVPGFRLEKSQARLSKLKKSNPKINFLAQPLTIPRGAVY